MARQRFAPEHSLAAVARFIPASDSSWDTTRLIDEYKTLRKDWDGEGDDPVSDPERGHIAVRYFAGLTRYDLDAGGVREYIDFEKNPEMWKLRRLTTEQRAEIEHLDSVGLKTRADQIAFMKGVSGVENASGDAGHELSKLLEHGPKPGREALWESKVMDAIGNYSIECLADVAEAVRRFNADLRPHEKKL